MASTFEVVECEDVLEFLVGVNNGAGSVFLPDFNLVDNELFYVVGLFVGQQSGQVLQVNPDLPRTTQGSCVCAGNRPRRATFRCQRLAVQVGS